MIIEERLEPWEISGGAVVTTKPGVVLIVDVKPMLALRPLVTFSVTAPGVEKLPFAANTEIARVTGCRKRVKV